MTDVQCGICTERFTEHEFPAHLRRFHPEQYAACFGNDVEPERLPIVEATE